MQHPGKLSPELPPDQKIDATIEMTLTLEECEDVAALAALLAP